MKRQTLPAAILSALFVAPLALQAAEWEPIPETAPAPADNPTTEAKVELGKQLYHDPRLSSTGTVACASCHNVMAGGEDYRPVAMGVHGQTGGRSAPTVWNAAFQSVQFWDGRAATLEDQAKGPIANPIEMGMANLDAAVERLKRIDGYQKSFKEVFGGENSVSGDNIAKAIAAYERTLITPNGPFDRYLNGDESALTDQQKKGMATFKEVGCVACHSGVNFSGPSLAVGTPFLQKFPTNPSEYDAKYKLTDDLGRYEVTKKDTDKHLFRVPTLRNIALTAPYFHNGSVKSLDEAVRVMGKAQLNKDLNKEQVADIVAFLESLTGEFPQQTMPRLPVTAGRTLVE